MGKFFQGLDADHRAFIERQKLFFTASAAAEGRVNLSPKGLDALRILDDRTVAYLDLTGSGNETSAHLEADGRLTIMLCAFEGAPLILRMYGRGEVHRLGSDGYEALIGRFEALPGARQIVVLHIESVQTSCGFGVPFYDYAGERPTLVKWAEAKGPEAVEAYRQTHNVQSIDGLPTGWR